MKNANSALFFSIILGMVLLSSTTFGGTNCDKVARYFGRSLAYSFGGSMGVKEVKLVGETETLYYEVVLSNGGTYDNEVTLTYELELSNDSAFLCSFKALK